MTSGRSVIAVDPGYDRVGIAAFSDEGLSYSECFIPDTKVFEQRLLKIRNRLKELVDEYRPAALALETLFFSKNQKTALKVAEARGAIIVTATEMWLPIYEYSPQAVKIAVTGSGAADKGAVIKMVERLIPGISATYDDEYDAIALGVAHQASFRLSPCISTSGE